MHPPIKTQKTAMLEPSIYPTPIKTPDMARQEFKADTDINTILDRFGMDTRVRSDGTSGAIDFSADLQSALTTILDARRAHDTLPDRIRTKYPEWTDLLRAMDEGSFDKALLTPQPPPDTVPAPPPTEPPNG